MKKLNWNGLDFLKWGDRAERATPRNEIDVGSASLAGSNLRWSSESRLAVQSVDTVTHCIVDCYDVECKAQVGAASLPRRSGSDHRASFYNLLGLGGNKQLGCGDQQMGGPSGILDTLKRKFQGNFRARKSDLSKLKQRGKRHSISLCPVASIPVDPAPVTVETPLVEKNNQCNTNQELEALQETCDDGAGSVHEPEEEAAEVSEAEAATGSPAAAVSSSSSSNTNLAWELFKLVKFGWYWGRMTGGEAERKLADQPDGAFLVRDSSDDCHLLSLSFRSYGRTLHTRIEHSNGFFSFYAYPEAEQHSSVGQLIEHLMDTSRAGIFCYSRSRSPGSLSYPVRLTKAVSRFSEVLPLQYMCRFVIRQYVRMDHIRALPLPESLKSFIVQGNS